MDLSVNSGQTQGYTFDIIGYDQWPSVSIKYAFKNIGPIPQLQLNFKFDTNRYAPPTIDKNTEIPEWQQNAAADLVVFKNIYYQLNWQYATDEKPDEQIRVIKHAATTTLTPAEPISFADEDVVNLSKFVKTIIGWLQRLIDGVSTNRRPTRTPVMKPVLLPVTGVLELKSIFEIGVTVAISRVDADTNTQISQSIKTIHPDIKTGVSLKAGQKAFAQSFETAFKSPGAQIKLAAGRGDYNNATQLWVVRWADSDKDNGVCHYNITPGNAVSFAPVPLSRSFINGDINVPAYTSGQGIEWNGTKTSARFAGVDLDGWMRIFLEAIDKVLEPATIDAVLTCATLYTLQQPDGINPLGEIRAVKAGIARQLVKQLAPVITEQTGNLDNATQHITNLLNHRLANFYTGTAIIQFNATVSADSGAGLTNLYGKITQVSKSGAVSFSEGVISNTATSTLSFSVKAKDAGLQSYLPVSVTFQPDGLDYTFDEGVIIPLSFIIPPAGQSTVLSANIPMVLRACPQPSSVIEQLTGKTYADDAVIVQTLKQYDYNYRYIKQITAQDAIETSLTINSTDLPATSAYGDADNLFENLALFVSFYPQIAADLEASLPVINNETTVSSEAYKTALPALVTLAELVTKVKSALSATVIASPENLRQNAQPSYSFTLKAGPVDPATDNRLLLHVTTAKKQATPLEFPSIQIDGYNAVLFNTVDTDAGITKSYTYASGEGESLLFNDQLNTISPTINLSSFDILSAEKLDLTLNETRNKNLLPNPQGGYYTTDERFVYTVAQHNQIPAFTPGLFWNGVEINLATINTTTAKTNLQVYLQLLFSQLFNNPNSVTYLTRIQVSYEYQLDDSGILPRVSIPVLLMPKESISTIDKGNVAMELYNAIKSWLNNMDGLEGNNPRLNFEIDIFTSLKESGTPLLSTDRLYLNLSDVN